MFFFSVRNVATFPGEHPNPLWRAGQGEMLGAADRRNRRPAWHSKPCAAAGFAHHPKDACGGAVVLPTVISLLRLAIDAPDEATKEGKRLAASCRALESDAPMPRCGGNSADVIQAAFVGKANSQALRRMVGDERQHLAVRIIGRVCAGHAGSPEVLKSTVDNTGIPLLEPILRASQFSRCVGRRIQAVLQVILRGIRVRDIPEEIQRWLKG